MSIPTKAVKAVIINKNNEILILQRNPKRSGQDNWDLPGGIVELLENQKEALVREVTEELNLKIKILSKGREWSFIRDLDNKKVHVQNYNCEIIEGDIKLSEEHIDYKWVSKVEIKQYPVKDESFYFAIKK